MYDNKTNEELIELAITHNYTHLLDKLNVNYGDKHLNKAIQSNNYYELFSTFMIDWSTL